MRLKLGQCNRCQEIIYVVREAGLVWTADITTPLEAGEAVDALLGGRELYRIRYVGTTPVDLSPATPAILGALRGEPSSRPVVVPNHGCPPEAARSLPGVGWSNPSRTVSQAACGPFLSVLGVRGGYSDCQVCGEPGF